MSPATWSTSRGSTWGGGGDGGDGGGGGNQGGGEVRKKSNCKVIRRHIGEERKLYRT